MFDEPCLLTMFWKLTVILEIRSRRRRLSRMMVTQIILMSLSQNQSQNHCQKEEHKITITAGRMDARCHDVVTYDQRECGRARGAEYVSSRVRQMKAHALPPSMHPLPNPFIVGASFANAKVHRTSPCPSLISLTGCGASINVCSKVC